VLANLRKVIADDSIRIEVMLNFPAASSPRKSQLMTALGDLADDENSVVVPMMIAGFTDSHYFRQKGLASYGFIPIEATQAQMRGVHGANERIGVKELGAGVRRMIDLLKLIGGRE
jgi:acetylornithine deacetylase/succinyl-diaminopimelate desuccinylase-like protein